MAAPYAARLHDELDHKPYDRAILDEFANGLDAGMTLDVGCGPGHVGRYLADHGVDVAGLDLSLEMARQARSSNPGLSFAVADLRSLPVPDASVVGIVAFYLLIHLAPPDRLGAFRELRRVLRDGAPLLVALHAGTGGLHTDEWLGRPVSVDVTLIERDELASLLEGSGFRLDRVERRHPYPSEHPTDRLYAMARAARSGLT